MDQQISSRLFDRRNLFVITLLVAAVIYCQFQFWKQPTRGDWSVWDYVAQVTARGGVPYRDVVEIKTPLSAYIGAVAIKFAEPFRVRDILAIRAVYVFLAMLTSSFTFLIAHDYFKSRRTGLLAAMLMLTFNSFGLFNNSGVQPKTLMILFGLLVLWAIRKDRPLTAGVFSMLSALSWQPGLLFTGVAGLAFSRYLTNWRDRKVVRLLIGAAIPLVILLLYFWIAGALLEFYRWCFHYTLTVYGPSEAHTPGHFLQHFVGLVSYHYAGETYYFCLAAVGLAFVVVRELWLFRRDTKHFLDRSYDHALWISTLVYVLFCMVDIQGGPDIIPLLPFVAIFFAVLIVFGLDKAALRIRPIAFAAVMLVVFFLSVADSFQFQVGFPTLDDQDKKVTEIVSHLEPEDKIFVHGQTELLVLSGLTNASKYIRFDHGKDTYLNNVEPGGFDGWFKRLKAERPKVVGLSRLGGVGQSAEIERWVRNSYELREGKVFPYYLRKD